MPTELSTLRHPPGASIIAAPLAPCARRRPRSMAVPDETRVLLRRWHAGERAAIDELIARDLPWIRDHVHTRLGPLLRARGETVDYVQEAILVVLQYTPRFVTDDRCQFRALLARIVENHLRDAHDHHAAARRTPVKERAMPTDSVLDLDRPQRAITQPGEVAERHEQQAWVRLALELLEPPDRQVLLLRQWQGLEFAAVGERLGIAENAARMRFQRALPKLARQLKRLRSGRGLDQIVEP